MVCLTVFSSLLFAIVFYVKRSSAGGGKGPLWSLGRSQFCCPSRDLRDQWVSQLRIALKTHCESSSVPHRVILPSLFYLLLFLCFKHNQNSDFKRVSSWMADSCSTDLVCKHGSKFRMSSTSLNTETLSVISVRNAAIPSLPPQKCFLPSQFRY